MPIARCRRNRAPIGSFGCLRRLSLEPGNEPRARRARRRIRPIDRVQSNEAVLVLGHIELDEPPSLEILAHHWFGHIAPADAFLQQHVLRAEIGQAQVWVPITPRSRPCVSGERSVSTSWMWSRPAPGALRPARASG